MRIANPESPDWCVYQFEVQGVPFYVGIGRTEVSGRPGRASDRLRWVCSQIKRELKDKRPKKWDLHTSVMKYFILTPEPIKCRFIGRDLCRDDALQFEKRRIAQLLSRGHVLANVQHNRRPLPTEKDVIRYILRNSKEKSKQPTTSN
jgi:hypothetical protein